MYKKLKLILVAVLMVAIVAATGTFLGCKKPEAVPAAEAVQDINETEEDLQDTEDAAAEAVEEEVEEVLTVEVTDGLGTKISLEKPAEKVIVFAPSALEVIDALGAMDKVIGVDNWNVESGEPLAQGFEGFGDFQGLNIEKIVEANPDIIVALAGGSEEDYQRVMEFGVKVYTVEAASFERIYEEIVNMGAIIGLKDEATELKNKFQQQVDEIDSKVKNLGEDEKPKVFYEIFDDPLWSAGKDTFINDLIVKAGGANIVAIDDLAGYVEYSVEKLIENNPDIMIAGDGGMYVAKTEDFILADSRFSSIDAVINKKVYILPENPVVRPNHNTIKGLEMFARAIHPELFGEFEIIE